MSRKLIIDGNAVYEVDEDCMLKNRLNVKDNGEVPEKNKKTKNRAEKKDI